MQLFATFVNNKCNSFKFLVQQKLALLITYHFAKLLISISHFLPVYNITSLCATNVINATHYDGDHCSLNVFAFAFNHQIMQKINDVYRNVKIAIFGLVNYFTPKKFELQTTLQIPLTQISINSSNTVTK